MASECDAEGAEGIGMDIKNEDVVEKKAQGPDAGELEGAANDGEKLEESEVKGLAGGDKPIELPEI